MSDARKILERGVGGFAPHPGAYERVLERRDHKRRNERVATVLLALAITIALIVIGTSVRHREAPIPVSSGPTVGAVGVGLSRVDPDTGAITPLSNAKITPVWGGIDISPDGSEIAFPRRVHGHLQIFVMGADGKGIRQLTHQPLGAWAPAWSPSGREIAFASDVGSGPDLFVMDADGSSVQRVTRTPDESERTANWSPDGSRLAFDAAPGYTIGIADVTTGRTSLMTPSEASGESVLAATAAPAWSPDGNWIAFEGSGVSGFQHGKIWLMHPDGTDAHLLAGVMGVEPEESSPSWSPDGREIAFCESGVPGSSRCSIAIVDVATGTIRTVTTNATDVLDWSPRGYLVVLGSRR
jgi:Tol biopolymer transport system component